MRQFVLWLVAVCSAQFNINEILYDSIKGTIDNAVPENSPLQVRLDALNDTLVLHYIENDVIPLLTDLSRDDAVKSNEVAVAIINENFIVAFNLSDNVLTLVEPLSVLIDSMRDYNQQVQSSAALSTSPVDFSDAQVLRELILPVLNALDHFFESSSNIFGTQPARFTSFLHSHVGLGLVIGEIATEDVTIDDIDLEELALFFTDAMQVYVPEFQGTQWMAFITMDLLPALGDILPDSSVDVVFSSLSELISPSLFEALNITLTSAQRNVLKDQFKKLPDTLGYNFIVNVFCLNDGYNLCMAPDYMSYFLNQLDLLVSHLSTAYYQINVNFVDQLDVKLADNLLRIHSWVSAMLLEPSQYRTNRINTLVIEENALATVFPDSHPEWISYLLQLVDSSIEFADQITIMSQFMNENLDVNMTELNQTQIVLIELNVTTNASLGDVLGDYMHAAIDLRDSLIRLDDDDSAGRTFQSHLVRVSRAFENFLSTEFGWFLATGRREEVASKITTPFRVWSLANQAAQLALVVVSDTEGVQLPEEYNLVAIIDMILSENLLGEYEEPARALDKFYHELVADVNAIQRLFEDFALNDLKVVLESSTDVIIYLNTFLETFNVEYAEHYENQIGLFEQIYALTNQIGNGSLWVLLASKLHDLADTVISIVEIVAELRS